MSNQELEIMAAKALGASVTDELVTFKQPISFDIFDLILNSDSSGCVFLQCELTINIKQLKFTTSYDWTMLGVIEVMNRGLYHSIPNNTTLTQFICERPTPEEITLPWIEILEEHEKVGGLGNDN